MDEDCLRCEQNELFWRIECRKDLRNDFTRLKIACDSWILRSREFWKISWLLWNYGMIISCDSEICFNSCVTSLTHRDEDRQSSYSLIAFQESGEISKAKKWKPWSFYPHGFVLLDHLECALLMQKNPTFSESVHMNQITLIFRRTPEHVVLPLVKSCYLFSRC